MRYIPFIFLTLLSNIHAAEPVPVINLPYYEVDQRPGWEERGPDYQKWLASAVRLSNGSGTMCYYDGKENWMYVISVGHLFSRRYRSAEYFRNNPAKRTIEVFYHNEKKLPKPKKYKAEILCYTNFSTSVYDVSLLRFHPDWNNPWHAPIAPRNYKLKKGRMYHSTGCDGLTPAAHYLVEYVREQGESYTEIVTQLNDPRGGRSGGGVMTDNGQLIFMCSRSNSYAWWTSLQQIHKFLEDEGFSFVLTGARAREIPAFYHGLKLPKTYIPRSRPAQRIPMP